jgi:hypothetical protein
MKKISIAIAISDRVDWTGMWHSSSSPPLQEIKMID